MLIEQIIKEAEAFKDIFQLFNKYPEYQKLFSEQYQFVRAQDPTADEATVVGLAQERTGMILRSRGIDLNTGNMKGTDIVNTLNTDPEWNELKNKFKQITQDEQAKVDKNMQNIRGKSSTNMDNFGQRYGSDGRRLMDPKYYRDRTIGDVVQDVDTVKALQGIAAAAQGGSGFGAMAAGNQLAKALPKDLGKYTGVSSIAKGIKNYGDTSLKYRPQYTK